KISAEAVECMQDCVSEFMSFISRAKCQESDRKTITSDHILTAMSNLGFEHYTAVLKMYLDKYRAS
ncbi:putative CCAAT-binding transcription factor, partial [Lasiosphaeria ovina]